MAQHPKVLLPCVLALAVWTHPALAKVTITFMEVGDTYKTPAARKAIALFEALHPEIRVNYSPQDFGASREKLQVMIAAGTPYDVSPMYDKEYVKRGLVRNLEPFIRRDRFDLRQYLPQALSAPSGVYKGSRYALPYGVTSIVLAYNKDLHDRVGLSYPTQNWASDDWDWTQFVANAKKLTRDDNGDGKPEVWGIGGLQWPYAYSMYWGQRLFNDDFTSFVGNTPLGARAFQLLADLAWKEGVKPVSGTMPFNSGKAGMAVEGAWGLPNLRTTKARWDFAVSIWTSVKSWQRLHGVNDDQSFLEVARNYAKLHVEYGITCAFLPWDDLVVFSRHGDDYAVDATSLRQYIEVFHAAGVRSFALKHVAWRDNWETDYLLTLPLRLRRENGTIGMAAPQRVCLEGEPLRATVAYLRELRRIIADYPDTAWAHHVADEPLDMHFQLFRQLTMLIKAEVPEIRTMEAVQAQDVDKFAEVLDIVVLPWGWREDLGKTLKGRFWWYICLLPKGERPNRMIDQESVRYAIVPWLAWKHGLDGYLEWGLNCWGAGTWYTVNSTFNPWASTAVPIEMADYLDISDYPPLPPGDAYLVYPWGRGLAPSIRLEAFREGMQDYRRLVTIERCMQVRREVEDMAIVESGQRLLDEIARDIVPSDEGYTRDASALDGVRTRVLEWLDSYATLTQ